MNHHTTSPRVAPVMEPGVWVREINGHCVYLGIRQDGTPLPGIAVPIDDETDDDVIVALADRVFPSCRLTVVAGGAGALPTSPPPRAALRLEPAPPRSPRR